MLEKRSVFTLTSTQECFMPRMLHGPFVELFSLLLSFLPLTTHKLSYISTSNLQFVALISIHRGRAVACRGEPDALRPSLARSFSEVDGCDTAVRRWSWERAESSVKCNACQKSLQKQGGRFPARINAPSLLFTVPQRLQVRGRREKVPRACIDGAVYDRPDLDSSLHLLRICLIWTGVSI